jgi:hypothetical protein
MRAFLVNVLHVVTHHASIWCWNCLTSSRRHVSHVTGALFIARQIYAVQLQTLNFWTFSFVPSAVPTALLHKLVFKVTHKYKSIARIEVRWMGRPQLLPVILSPKSLYKQSLKLFAAFKYILKFKYPKLIFVRNLERWRCEKYNTSKSRNQISHWYNLMLLKNGILTAVKTSKQNPSQEIGMVTDFNYIANWSSGT